ncbi:hypothetical protein SAMN05518801_102335 [Novosphingobium sp. CF614]|uniref:sulfotransferase n=1 Tax=Novosphingobium sp. CF614 TaxID=1884364 RepID=UPI0008E1A176|nr:sulfotransferase [Novosphingobium sp. CF614]SFF87004.1 hypothetical protein SAMN05518801_102335 [Novosphingobium sp. CF614]
MIQVLRESGKRTAGWLLGHSMPRYRYRHCVFILAHMRCGSTALSNILCSRADVSGYGEAHVRHGGPSSPGQLALNQMRRGGWNPRAGCLFDKILHSRHDRDAPPEFFEARAIFVVRRPGDAIHSIVRLFAGLDRGEYATQAEAGAYYVERLAALESLWHKFPARRRIGLTHEALVREPDRALAAISARLGFLPPLENRYVSLAASRRGGGGDPLVSGRHTRIDPALSGPARDDAPLDLPAGLADAARERYRRLAALFEDDRALA